MNLLILLAETGADAETTAANPIASLLPFLLIGLVFYFLIIRPQRKRQSDQQKLIRSLGMDDEIVTIGGFHGLIVGETDSTFELQIADGVVVTIARNAVSKAVNPAAVEDADDEFDGDFDGDFDEDADWDDSDEDDWDDDTDWDDDADDGDGVELGKEDDAAEGR